MKLLTHNMLQCHAKGCNQNNFPLSFTDVELELAEVEFNPEFVAKLLRKIDYPALLLTAQSLNLAENLPPTDPTIDVQDFAQLPEELLRTFHHILLEVKIHNGKMVCGNCGHIYIIKDFIPNMLLQDDEV